MNIQHSPQNDGFRFVTPDKRNPDKRNMEKHFTGMASQNINIQPNYSSKNPVVENKEIEQEFLGEKDKYAIERKYWSHELTHKNEKVGFIFVETYIKKNTKYDWSKGSNNITFKSFFSQTKRPSNC